jgi:hypothetical protein
VLLLGVFQLLHGLRWQQYAANAIAAVTCGGACLMQAHRRWSIACALGLGLTSLRGVNLSALVPATVDAGKSAS